MATTPPVPGAYQQDGNWFGPDGQFLVAVNSQGATPAQLAATPGPVQTGADGKKFRMVDGQKWYLPPMTGPSDPGGGLIHGRTQWNPQTGQYDTPIDWGKVLSMVTAGIITAGAADAILAATPALAATAPTGASAVSLEGTSAGLGGASTTIGAGTVAPVAASAPGFVGAGLPGAGTALTGPAAATSVADEFAGPIAANGATTAATGVSYADILKYGLPTAGNLIGGLVQANAQGNSSAAQQKYLEEALAYEKEKDLYQRGVDATAVATANQRYAGYQDRIAPFIANGTSSNDRMSALLGLPPRTGGSSGGGGGYGSSGGSQGVPLSPAITQRVLDYYKSIGVTPTGPGTGPTDSAYYAGKDAETGGLTTANDAYWFGPNSRIAGDLAKAGIHGTPPAAGAPPATAAPSITTPPQARAADVQMRGPDGSVKTVPADQVDHYKQLGATLLGAAA